MLINPFLNLVDKIYRFIISIGSNLQSLFLLYMRLTWGHQFFLTGLGKFEAIEKTAQYFAALHIPFPEFHAYLVSSLELVGGLFLIFGFASRLISIPLIVITLVALSTAHAPNLSNLRFLTEPLALVHQTPYPFLITALLVFIFGPGRISIDAWIKRTVDKKLRY